MKAPAFPYLVLCVLFVSACGPTASRSPTHAVTFDTTRPLDDFDFPAIGDGKQSEWLIIDSDADRGLAPPDTHSAENRLPFAIYLPFSGRDVYMSTRFMTLSGNVDQAAGVFIRFRSLDHYYAVRADSAPKRLLTCAVCMRTSIGRGTDEIGCGFKVAPPRPSTSKAWPTYHRIAATDDKETEVVIVGKELRYAPKATNQEGFQDDNGGSIGVIRNARTKALGTLSKALKSVVSLMATASRSTVSTASAAERKAGLTPARIRRMRYRLARNLLPSRRP